MVVKETSTESGFSHDGRVRVRRHQTNLARPLLDMRGAE